MERCGGRSASAERAAAAPATGNLVRHLQLRKGDPDPVADVVVTGEYQVGMQDQAFLGPESGLAVPAEDGGVELYVATQWLHVDQRQICAALGLPPEKVRLTLAGVGGAFGGREDLSMHVHACLLALHTGKPVKMVYNREESFFGHVHRHPARDALRARRPTGTARWSTSRRRSTWTAARTRPAPRPWSATRARWASGRTWCRNVQVDAYGAYTNNPPCGAMRGFGSVQAAFAYEAQMDKLAGRAGPGPGRAALPQRDDPGCAGADRAGDRQPGAGRGDAAAGAGACRCRRRRGDGGRRGRTCGTCRAASANTTHGEGVVRGVGYAVAYKNVGFSEGFDDYSTARVRLEVLAGEAVATVHTAAAEVGQGLVTVEQQIARTELGVRPGHRAPQGHRRWAAAGRRPRPGRPTSPAARSRPPARRSASARWR